MYLYVNNQGVTEMLPKCCLIYLKGHLCMQPNQTVTEKVYKKILMVKLAKQFSLNIKSIWRLP